MNKHTLNSISNKTSSAGVSHKDAVTSTESRRIPDEEPMAPTNSTEDDPGIQYSPNNDLDYLGIGSDREPMYVIVDSSCVSNPSSKELLIDSRLSSRDTIMKKHYIMNVKPVDVPSTSRDLRNEILLPPQMKDSDSNDEMPLIDINLQSDNELSIADSDCDNDSIVISYLKNKGVFMEMEDTSENSLDALVPSFPGSPRSFAGHSSVASLLSNEDVNARYRQAIEFLHHDNDFLIAAELGDEKMLRLLINEGANIHEMDHLGRNALHLAVCSGNRHVVGRLLNLGVSPNVKDKVGMTPLSLCLMRRPSWRMATMLFNYGAVILPRVTPMDTGLFLQFVMMCEPTREEERILRLLVEKGAIVNDPDAPGGRQALHFAAMSNNTRLINILVDLGADLFLVNHRNETPKEVAATFKCKEAYDLLEQFETLLGANSDSSQIDTEFYSSSD